MNKGVKFRLYPNSRQRNQINQTLGCSRLIYNRGLDMRNKAYEDGEKANYARTSAMLTELKKQEDYSFLKDADSIALQQSLRDLDRAFKNFFDKKSRHPQFKSKHDYRQSYRTINQKNGIRIDKKYIKLPKLGYVRFKQTMKVGHINHAVIERTPTGKYFIVLNVDFEPEKLSAVDKTVGVDVGIKNFCHMSDRTVIDNPRHLEQMTRRLKREQRRLSRKKKGSSNRQKQRLRVARIHERIADQRNDFLQKLSTKLIRESQTICIEDLNVKGMVRNHKLARCISSASWSKFFSMLEYKASWYGRTVTKVPTMYPSSQTCNCCGYKNPEVRNLAVREWECPVCHTVHDRDLNASINILYKGLSMAA